MFGSIFEASAAIGVPSIDAVLGFVGTVFKFLFSFS